MTPKTLIFTASHLVNSAENWVFVVDLQNNVAESSRTMVRIP